MKKKTVSILTSSTLLLALISIIFILVSKTSFGTLSVLTINTLFGGNGYIFNPIGFFSVICILTSLVFYSLSYKVTKFFQYGFSFLMLGSILLLTSPSLFGYMNNISEGFFPDAYLITGYILCFSSLFVSLPIIFEQNALSTSEIVEMAMLVAMAIVLDLPFLKFRIQANGGSISFEMVPLVILALRHGPFKGFLGIGVVYGFISCLMGGSGLAYYPFDYLLAFGSLAIVGFFTPLILPKDRSKKVHFKGFLFITISILIACTAKYFFHVISGVVFWETPFWESMIYSATYVPLSCLLTIVAVCLLYKPILVINALYPVKK